MGWFSKEPEIVPAPVRFKPAQPMPELDPALFAQVGWFVASALQSRAEVLAMTSTAQGAQVAYIIDGVTHEAPRLDPQTAQGNSAVLKLLAGIDPNQRRPLSRGNFEVMLQRDHFRATLTCQLSQTAEKLVVAFDDGRQPPERLVDAGMREKVYAQYKEIIAQPGVVLIAVPPKHGFTTTFDAAIRSIDRYLQNVVAVEDAAAGEHEIENAPITTYDSKAGQSPFAVLPQLIRTYPDVICCRRLVDADTVDLLCDQVSKERFILMGIPARDAVEGLLRVLAMKADREKFVRVVNAVISQRLIRKMCDTCKQPYAPPPQLLQQLGIPQGRIRAFYRQGPPPPPPEPLPEGTPPPPCPNCNGVGYRGRTALYEMLVVNDGIRKALKSTNKLDVLRAAAKKAGHNGLMEEGVVAAALGVTSIQEVIRVLKS